MGFFASGKGAEGREPELPTDVLHRLECRACPLNNAGCQTPKMEPTGSRRPLIYMLGEAPGATEDEEGEQFVGESGQLLRSWIPSSASKLMRWNNVIRTRPPNNRTPTPVEIECCRPSIVRDIEEHKPLAIFGFGGVPLEWAIGATGMQKWRGRRVPVRIGSHTCWFYPMYHPAFLLRMARGERRGSEPGSELERATRFDLLRAIGEVTRGKLPEPVVHTREDAERGLRTLYGAGGQRDVDEVLQTLERMKAENYVGFDYETNALRPYRDHTKVLSVALSGQRETLAFALYHPGAQWPRGSLRLLLDGLQSFLAAPHVRKIVHKLAFEMEWTAVKFGKHLLRQGLWEDTMTQAAILDERIIEKERGGCLNLDFLVLQYYGLHLKALSPLSRSNLADEPVKDVLLYNGMDAKYHRALFLPQRQRLKDEGLLAPYKQKLRQVPTVVLTQIKGVPVDQSVVSHFETDFNKRLRKIESRIADDKAVRRYEKAIGKRFEPTNNKQILPLLKDYAGATQLYDDRREKFVVDEPALQRVGTPLALDLLEHRTYAKLLSTYVLPLKASSPLVYEGGWLHPILNTCFTETGRLSSEDPNEQNFPKHEHKEVRSMVKARPGHVFLAMDYGQIEARIIAMASRDKQFVKALWENYDIHMEWAERLACAYPRRIGGKAFLKDKAVMKELRQVTKNTWVFAAFFGAKPPKLAAGMEIPLDIAEEQLEEFWGQFAGVREWQKDTIAFYRENGYVEMLTGRRRRAPMTVNQILNTPIQGATADMVMDAMNRLSEQGEYYRQPNLQIHDDLTFHMPVELIDKHAEVIIDTMLDLRYDFINVPITIEMSIGDDWASLQEVEKFSSTTWRKQ